MAWGNRGNSNARRQEPKRQFTKVAQVALWESTQDGQGSPVLYGSVELESGEELRISLWNGESEKHKAPVLTGSITREVGGQQREPAPAQQNYSDPVDFDDDAPF